MKSGKSKSAFGVTNTIWTVFVLQRWGSAPRASDTLGQRSAIEHTLSPVVFLFCKSWYLGCGRIRLVYSGWVSENRSAPPPLGDTDALKLAL